MHALSLSLSLSISLSLSLPPPPSPPLHLCLCLSLSLFLSFTLVHFNVPLSINGKHAAKTVILGLKGHNYDPRACKSCGLLSCVCHSFCLSSFLYSCAFNFLTTESLLFIVLIRTSSCPLHQRAGVVADRGVELENHTDDDKLC